MTDTEKKIAEIREALEKVTPEKWKYMPSIHSEFAYEVCVDTFFDPIVASVIRKEDANLIANAPEWLRFLIQAVEMYRELMHELDKENDHLHEKINELEKLKQECNKLIEALNELARDFYRLSRHYHACLNEAYDERAFGKYRAFEQAAQMLEKVLKEHGVRAE